MTLPGPLELVKESFSEWQKDKASRLAAALAYYTAFSIAPLLLLLITIAGVVLGDKAAEGTIYSQLEGLLGPEAAGVLQSAIANSRHPGANSISAFIGIATLVWSASNVFSQLQDALNTIWEVEPKPAGIVGSVKRRIVPLSMVLGIGFILLVSLVLSTILSALSTFLGNVLPGSNLLWEVVNNVISFGVIALLFAAIYKMLPDVEIRWSDVWVGALVTALLFIIGKTLIGFYLGHASVGSTYGAAGSLLVFLVWVYYSAQILFFGAEFTQVYARKRGTRIVPSPHAVPVTAEARAEQGMAPTPAGQAQAGAQPALASAASSASRPAAVSQQPEREPAPVKKLLWTGISAATVAFTGLIAHRLTSSLWLTVFHEPPPEHRG